MALFKNVNKRRTERLKRSGRYKKVTARRKKINKAVKKVKETAKKVGGFALLAPYKGLMSNALRKRGYGVPSQFDDLVRSFYTNIVKRNSFDEYDTFHDGGLYAHQAPIEQSENAIGVSVAAIVSGILSFINGIKDKKEQGERLTPTQETILRESERVEREVGNIKESQKTSAIGEAVQQYWWVLVLGVVGIALLVRRA